MIEKLARKFAIEDRGEYNNTGVAHVVAMPLAATQLTLETPNTVVRSYQRQSKKDEEEPRTVLGRGLLFWTTVTYLIGFT